MFVVVCFGICGSDSQIDRDLGYPDAYKDKFKAYLVCFIPDLTRLYFQCLIHEHIHT